MKVNVPTIVTVLVLSATPLAAENYCPEIYLECPARAYDESISFWSQLECSGAEEWEIAAIRVITRNLNAKGLYDIVYTDCGSSGWMHRRPNHPFDGFNLGIMSQENCSRNDPEWRDWVLAFLMWDAEVNYHQRQLHQWRRIVRLATSQAPASCRRDFDCILATAVIANSAPGIARSIGREADWDAASMLESYVARRPTRHRQGRARAAEQEIVSRREEMRQRRRNRRAN